MEGSHKIFKKDKVTTVKTGRMDSLNNITEWTKTVLKKKKARKR